MVRMFIRHSVADYAAWRKAYDDFDAKRQSMGVTAQGVFQEAEHPNDVTVTHDFADMASAQAFAGSSELRETMQRAGVTSAPAVWFTNQS